MSSGVRLSGNYIVESVNAIKIPAGTDAQRPNAPSQGEMRFNTTGNALEIYNGGSWTVPTGGGGSTTTSTITGATQANPVIISTASAHNLIDSSYVNITGVVGMTELNGNNYYVDVLSSDSFALYSDSGLTAGVDGSGFTLYVSGGLVVSGSTSPGFLSLTDTPSTYSGAGKYLKVNPSNNGIEFDSLTTDDIIEGTNKFFNGKTTDDLPEGTGNLYLSTANLNTFGIDSLSDVKTTGSGHVPTDGQALVWDQTMGHWMPGTVSGGGSGTPGGSTTQVQFNNAGAFAGDSTFTFNSTTDTLSVSNLDVSGTFQNTASGTPTVLSANDLVLQADTSAGEIRLKASNVKLTDSPLQIKSYTNAQLGALSGNMIGQIAYISDGLLSQPGIAVYTSNGWEYIKPGVTGGSTISSISAATQANPVQITTSADHGLVNGQKLVITDVVGMTELNGNTYYANVVSGTIFTLYSDTALSSTVDGTAFTPYTSGGKVAGGIDALAPTAINDLSDVDTVSVAPTNGQALVWDATASKWEPGSVASAYGDSNVDTHLNTSSATANQVLSWTGTDYDWVAQGSGSSFNQSLNTGDNVTFASITTDVINTSTSGTPTLTSNSNVNLTVGGSVVVQQNGGAGGGFRLANLDTTQRNALAAANGEMIYNTTVNRIQAYQNNAWINIDDGTPA